MKSVVSLCVIIVVMCMETRSADGLSIPPVELRLAIGETDQRLSLNIVLKNVSSGTIEIHNADLPWMRTASLSLILVVPTALGEPLAQRIKEAASIPGRVIVKKGEVLSGAIDLEDRFPTIRDRLKEGKLFLFWAFELPDPIDKIQYATIGGFIEMRQSK